VLDYVMTLKAFLGLLYSIFFCSASRFSAKQVQLQKLCSRKKKLELREHLKGCSKNSISFVELLHDEVCEA